MFINPRSRRFLRPEIRLGKPPSRGLDQAKLDAVPRRIVVDAVHRVEFDDAPQFGRKYSKQLLGIAMCTDRPGDPEKGLVAILNRRRDWRGTHCGFENHQLPVIDAEARRAFQKS